MARWDGIESRSVRCPRCGAAVGAFCVGDRGDRRAHSERVQAATTRRQAQVDEARRRDVERADAARHEEELHAVPPQGWVP